VRGHYGGEREVQSIFSTKKKKKKKGNLAGEGLKKKALQANMDSAHQHS
jgi:hypothetical protein